MRNVVFGCLVLPLLVFSTGCGSKAQREAEDLMQKADEKSAAERDRQNKVVAEGDALWAAGEKKYDAAFEKYMVVVNASVPLMGKDALPKDVLARVYGRVIDVALDRRDNTALAQEVAVKALRKDIIPLTASKKAGPVLDAARKVVKAQDKETAEWVAKNGGEWKPPTFEQPPGGEKPNAGDLEGKTYAQIVKQLGQPHEDFRTTKKRNVGLATWKTGQDEYTVVGFVHAIDGSGRTVVTTTQVGRTKAVVENMKSALNNSFK